MKLAHQNMTLEAHELPDAESLIRDNLADPQARHLMVLTQNGAALPLMVGSGLLDDNPDVTTVLVGSEFEEDCAVGGGGHDDDGA